MPGCEIMKLSYSAKELISFKTYQLKNNAYIEYLVKNVQVFVLMILDVSHGCKETFFFSFTQSFSEINSYCKSYCQAMHSLT